MIGALVFKASDKGTRRRGTRGRRIADCGLRIVECGLRIADFGFRISDLPSVNSASLRFGLQN